MSGEREAGAMMKAIGINGCRGTAILGFLLLICAVLMPRYRVLATNSRMVGIACILIATTVNAAMSSRKAGRKRLLNCSLSNGIMLTAILIVSSAGDEELTVSGAAALLLIMLIGSFAGTILWSRGGKRKPYQRKYKT